MFDYDIRKFLNGITFFLAVCTLFASFRWYSPRFSTLMDDPKFLTFSIAILAALGSIILTLSGIRSIVRKQAKDFDIISVQDGGNMTITKYQEKILHGKEAVRLGILRLVFALINVILVTIGSINFLIKIKLL